MKTAATILIAFALVTPVIAQEKPTDDDLKKLQGKWLLNQTHPDGTPLRIIKQVAGNKETLSVYRNGNTLFHEHVVDFEIKKTDQVTVFTYRNQRFTAGPNKGVVKEGPFSYLYQIKGDRWFVVSGLMNGDETPLHVEWFERVKDGGVDEPKTVNAAELKKLQGEWSVVAVNNSGTPEPTELVQECRVVISGNQLTIDKTWEVKTSSSGVDSIVRGPSPIFTMTVRSGEEYHEMDLTLIGALPLENGAEDLTLGLKEIIGTESALMKGIYTLNGDELRLCVGLWNEKASQRPTDFKAQENRLLHILKRTKPE